MNDNNAVDSYGQIFCMCKQLSYFQVLYTKHERNKTKPSFEAEAFLNDSFAINVNYKPVRNSLYSLHMGQWLKYFSLKNFLILDGDKFIVDPLSQVSFNCLFHIFNI